MTPQRGGALTPKVLTQAQREQYFSEGYLYVERAIDDDWIGKLRAATEELVERSRKVTQSDAIFDLEPKHRPDAPRLRRVSNPVEQHPVFWEYCLKAICSIRCFRNMTARAIGPAACRQRMSPGSIRRRPCTSPARPAR